MLTSTDKNATKKVKREEFKKILMSHLTSAQAGVQLTDSALQDMCTQNNLTLELSEIKSCIRSMEPQIGGQLKKRLKRLHGEGYELIAGENQYNAANDEAKTKLISAVEKTGKRLEHIDLDQVSADLKQIVTSKILATSAIAQLLNHAYGSKKLTVKDATYIAQANYELKALALLRGEK